MLGYVSRERPWQLAASSVLVYLLLRRDWSVLLTRGAVYTPLHSGSVLTVLTAASFSCGGMEHFSWYELMPSNGK